MNRSIALLLSALLGSAALTGCGDACEEAATKTEECLGGDEEVYRGSQPECSGEIACSAECTVEASCEDIYAYFRNLPNPPDNPYTTCVQSCEGQ